MNRNEFSEGWYQSFNICENPDLNGTVEFHKQSSYHDWYILRIYWAGWRWILI